ncbi:MAG: hypothetical protein Q8O86_09280 [Dehalococcoidia bacterium]|nr:hypothetical protein [Dehalococcoidia bacterium]
MEQALAELKDMVLRRYPAATFEVAPGQDEAEAVHLIATVDVEDPDEVLDVVIDRVLELQIEEGLPVHLIPTRPLEREVQELRSPRSPNRPRIDWGAVNPAAR